MTNDVEFLMKSDDDFKDGTFTHLTGMAIIFCKQTTQICADLVSGSRIIFLRFNPLKHAKNMSSQIVNKIKINFVYNF